MRASGQRGNLVPTTHTQSGKSRSRWDPTQSVDQLLAASPTCQQQVASTAAAVATPGRERVCVCVYSYSWPNPQVMHNR